MYERDRKLCLEYSVEFLTYFYYDYFREYFHRFEVSWSLHHRLVYIFYLLYNRKKMESKCQKSLQSVGFKRFDPLDHSTQQSSRVDPIESSFTLPVTTTNQSIKVRVEGKLFLVPLPINHSELNMKWLVSEASRRYQK